MTDLRILVQQLSDSDEATRRAAAVELYRIGADRAQAAVRSWAGDKELARLVSGPPTVGVAVHMAQFAAIQRAWGAPPLASVPAEQDAREFEVRVEFDGALALLDILTTRDPLDANYQGEKGAIARFLAKHGEGVQQVEFPCKDVDSAAAVLRSRFGLEPVYPAARSGAGGTRVNFFLVGLPEGGRVLVELFERAPRSAD